MRTLSAHEAAAYLNMGVYAFRTAVARGELPPPLVTGRPRWSVAQLDAALAPPPETSHTVSPSPVDELMETINGLDPHALS